MKLRLLVMLLVSPILGLQDADQQTPRQVEDTPPAGVRFEPVHVYVDSGDAPLAAYQLSLRASNEGMRIVGIEGGEHATYAEPPYYDAKAMQRDEVILADFSLAAAEHLPLGRTRIATIHVLVNGEGDPQFEATIEVAADDGRGADRREGRDPARSRIMKHRYIKWTVVGLAVAVVASIGLIRNFGAGSNDGPDESQSLREVQTTPTVTAPAAIFLPRRDRLTTSARVEVRHDHSAPH